MQYRHNLKYCGKVLSRTTSVQTENSQNPKISAISRETKNIKVFPQGTYMVQNFIPKTSTILLSIIKGISKLYQLERE